METPTIASLIDTREKQHILWTLSDGRAYTAVELADYAKIPKQEAVACLQSLLFENMIVKETHRHHYYRLLNDQLAAEIEGLLHLEMHPQKKIYPEGEKLPDLKYCRSCHGHLAGKMGVKVTEKMEENNLLIKYRKDEKYIFSLTPKGEKLFADFHIDTEALRRKGGTFAKACLDFSERRHHLGGKLGVAFLETLKAKNWVTRRPDSRIHDLTEEGRKGLRKKLNLVLKD